MIVKIEGKDRSGEFTCGLELRDHIVVRAAPKVRFMMGWQSSRVHQYCTRRGWRHVRVTEPALQ